MIDYISSWAGSVVMAVVAISVLEMILPDVSCKKYIKTIIGVYILYIIISPAIRFFTGDDIKIDYSQYEKYFNTTVVEEDLEIPTLEEMYQKELEKQIQNDLGKIGYLAKVDVKIDLKKGVVEKINISAEKDTGSDIRIEKIEIGADYLQNELDEKNIQDIKQMISENYGIQAKDIYVNSR